MDRTVGAELGITAYGECELELQIAVARTPGLHVVEELTIAHENGDVTPVEVDTAHDGRLHLVTLPAGFSRVTYQARVSGVAELPDPAPADLSLYRRPSRYIESDTFGGFAVSEFGDVSDEDLLGAVSSWVGTRLVYVPGSSGPTTGATDTLLSGAGVCRDYAHLVIALLRSLRVPARLTAVYAPGCDPMDFHAVVEAFVSGAWQVVDATALAPRSSLVRIATGRDAADTAFMTTVSGNVNLDWSSVSAVADDGLPADDVTQLVALR
ncbi:transglutaminase-like domain-containing protein [Nocardioides sp. URHA0020]|uniref:transglutaminase-like domain-containing protein n=1 Tax=Nocardioides sp. URHA0020 TaxID=1380392 RepID=UPI00048E9CA0|nr:transglutaminase family protein [Nocardioides sp. URHA0020]